MVLEENFHYLHDLHQSAFMVHLISSSNYWGCTDTDVSVIFGGIGSVSVIP